MKKCIALIIAIFLCFSLTACGDNEEITQETSEEFKDITLMQTKELIDEFILPLHRNVAFVGSGWDGELSGKDLYRFITVDMFMEFNEELTVSYYLDNYENGEIGDFYDVVYIPKNEIQQKLFEKFDISEIDAFEYLNSYGAYDIEKEAYKVYLNDMNVEYGENLINKESVVLIDNEDGTYKIQFRVEFMDNFFGSNLELKAYDCTLHLQFNEETESYQYTKIQRTQGVVGELITYEEENESAEVKISQDKEELEQEKEDDVIQIDDEMKFEVQEFMNKLDYIINQDFSENYNYINNEGAFLATIDTLEKLDNLYIAFDENILNEEYNGNKFIEIYRKYFAIHIDEFEEYLNSYRYYYEENDFVDREADPTFHPVKLEIEVNEVIAESDGYINVEYTIINTNEGFIEATGVMKLKVNLDSSSGYAKYRLYENTVEWQ